VLNWRGGVRRDEQRALPVFVTFGTDPVGLQRPHIRTDFSEEESMGLNPTPPTFAILVCDILLRYILLAADMDRWEISEGCSP
jgi:hypothetical protein